MTDEKFKVRDFRNKGFFILDDSYLNGYARYLGVSATAVYLSLCRHADKEQSCFPSQKTIAKEHGITDRTVRTKIEELVKWNIIRIESGRTEKGTFLSNIYFLLDKSEWKRPEEMVSVGKRPEEKNDATRGKSTPCKVTHSKDTQIKTNGEANASGFSSIGSLLRNQPLPVAKASTVSGASYSWQDLAVNWWKKLSLDGKPTGSWFKLFRDDRKTMERACSWASDSGGKNLLKLTYWGFNQFKKYGKITYQQPLV